MQGGPNVGGEETLGGVFGALGQGLQGYVGGREQRKQDDMQKSEFEERRAAAGAQEYDNLQKMVSSNPLLAKDPNFQNYASGILGKFGMEGPASFAVPQAQIDDKDWNLPTYARKLKYQQLQSQGYDLSFVPPEYLTAEPAPAPAERVAALNDLSRQFTTLQTQGGDPKAFLTYAKGMRAYVGNELVNSFLTDPDVLGHMTQLAQSKIDALAINNPLIQAKIEKLHADAKLDVERIAMGQAEASHWKAMDARDVARLNLSNQEFQHKISRDKAFLDLAYAKLAKAGTSALDSKDTATLSRVATNYRSRVAELQAEQENLIVNQQVDPDDPTVKDISDKIKQYGDLADEYDGLAASASSGATSRAMGTAGVGAGVPQPPVASTVVKKFRDQKGRIVNQLSSGAFVYADDGKPYSP
jgi:hypothetical protein